MELLENDTIAGVSVDTNQSEKLLRVLDTVVIRLEGGTDDDIEALDEKAPEIPIAAAEETTKATEGADTKSGPGKTMTVCAGTSEQCCVISGEGLTEAPLSIGLDPVAGEDLAKENGNGVPKKKRKRSASGSSNSSSSSSSDSDSPDKEVATKPVAEADDQVEEQKEVAMEEPPVAEMAVDEQPDQEMRAADDSSAAAEAARVKAEGSGDEEESVSERKPSEETITEAAEIVDLDKEKTEVVGSRALHKTSSIFLRNLAPTITKAEVEAVCRRYDGYLRVAIADPLVERRWFRRGWVSFRRDVNIKEICWNLNNIRVSGPIPGSCPANNPVP